MSVSKIVISDTLADVVAPDALGVRSTATPREDCIKLSEYFMDLAAGQQSATLQIETAGARATGTLTFTSAPTAAQTCVIAGQTITARASGAVANEFNIGGTISISAANLAAAINASTNLSQVVTATSALGVVTITSVVPGRVGNGLILTTAMSNTSVSAFTGGTAGTLKTIDRA